MTPTQFTRRLVLLGVLLGSAVLSPGALLAQAGDAAMAHGRIEALAGDVVEILGLRPDNDAQYDWVLTQNGTFVEAGRESIYRTRLTQEGVYALDGQLSGNDGSRRLHLEIDILPRGDEPAGQAPEPEGIGLAIVTTNLPGGDSGVRIAPESPLLTLFPSAAVVGPIGIDLDTRRDSDGDGDPGNDNDVADTLFSSEHNPLHVWYAMPENTSPMHLWTTAEDGTLLEQTIGVVGGALPVPTGAIAAGNEQNGAVNFSFGIADIIDPSSVVYLWDFGDGRQSMVDEPKHTYGNNGQYTVRVSVREMQTGRLLGEGEINVSINGIPEIVGGTSSSSSSVSSVPGQPAGGGTSIVWTLVSILSVLLSAVALGALAVWGIPKLLHREGGLQKALEQAEGKFTNQPSGDPVSTDTAPATMKLKRPEPPPGESPAAPEPPPVSQETIEQAIETARVDEKAPVPRPQATAPVEAAAPAWLQKGLETTKQEQAPAPMPVFAPQPEPVPETPIPPPPIQASPLPETIPDAATLTEEDLLPPWLKEQPTQETPTEPITPAPAPVAPVMATPAPLPPPPAPVMETPVTPPPAPAPLPIVPAPIVPEPSPARMAPAPSVISAVTPPPGGLPDAEGAERERERKRRKRQRYRENLKKRNSEAGLPVDAAQGRRPAGAETKTLAPDVPAPVAPLPPVTTPEIPAPVPTPPPPPPAPVMENPIAPAAPPAPVVQDIPPANLASQIAPPEPVPDDNVAFIIKAEGVTDENQKKL